MNSSPSVGPGLFLVYMLVALVLVAGMRSEFEKTREACRCRKETMDPKKLAAWAQAIAMNGPSRVVINAEGEATTPRRAKEDHGIEPSIIYIREDGWTLGTVLQFDTVTQNMWRDEWVARMWRDEEGKWHWSDWDVSSGSPN